MSNARILGTLPNGKVKEIPVTPEGHVEVALHAPRLPFGSVHTEKLTPVFQNDAVYGVNATDNVTTTGHSTGGVTSGTVTGTNNLFTCSTGTTSLSFATLQSRKRLRYRPGQGIVARYTAIFSEPAASSILVAGVGSSESGFYFGYNGTSFGILHSTGGVRRIQTLTVSAGSNATTTVTVTLNGVANTVNVTNSSSTLRTAYEISIGTYTGWKAQQVGSTVVFVADSVGPLTTPGTYSISFAAGTGAASFTGNPTLAGVASSDTWIYQADWNGDKLDGTGPSGVTLDPQMGNVYQIDIQYLGFGGIVFKVEVADAGNNPDFVVVHTIRAPNTRTTPTLTQPSFPFTMAAYSAGSTTNVSVSCASYAGFIEGDRVLNGPRLSYTGTKGTTTTITAIGTIRNDYVFGGRANQSVINVLDLNFTARSTNNTYTTLYIYRNAVLGGTPNFASYATNSCSSVDTAGTTITTTSANQLIWSGSIMELGTIDHDFPDNIQIQPGESLTFAVACSSSTGFATVSMNTREDH